VGEREKITQIVTSLISCKRRNEKNEKKIDFLLNLFQSFINSGVNGISFTIASIISLIVSFSLRGFSLMYTCYLKY